MLSMLTSIGIVAAMIGANSTVAASSQFDDLGATVAGSTEAMLEYVAEHIRYEPYSGVLRGPEGTIASRSGNSADQALLLASLLADAGVPYRFAVGEVDDAVASSLLESSIVDAETAHADAISGMSGALMEDGTDPIEAGDPAPSERIDRWVDEKMTDAIELITSQLADADIELSAGFSQLPASELTRHVWVQANEHGEWIDLDPSLPTNPIGQPLAVIDETTDALPDDMHHVVELAVVGERLEDGSLIAEDLVSVDGPAWELAGQPIVIGNVDESALPTLAGRFEAVLDAATFRPMISVGDSAHIGKPFVIAHGAGDAAAGLGGGFLAPGASAPEATAQWLELRLTAPDREPVTIRREVFDRVGDAARAAGTLEVDDLAPLSLLELGGGHEPLIGELQDVTWLAIETGVPTRSAPIRALDAESPAALAIVPLGHHEASELAGHIVLAAHGVRPFRDAPNVTALTTSLQIQPGGALSGVGILDIWFRSYGVLPVEGIEAPDFPALFPGVLAQVVERLLAGDASRDAGDAAMSVGAVFEAAQDQGLDTRVLMSPGASSGLAYSSDTLATLERSLTDGWVAIAPERPVSVGGAERTGWWLVDPTTGRVVDETDNGRGGAVAEVTVFLAVAGATLLVVCAIGPMVTVNWTRWANTGFKLVGYDGFQPPTVNWARNNITDCMP